MRDERTVSGLHAHLAQRLPAPRAQDGVLDLGCGSGAWLARLGGLGFGPLYGVDRDIAPAQGVAATLIAADLDEDAPPLERRQFGLITAIEMVEHLANPGRMLAFAGERLAPDGWLLVTTPNVHALTARLRWLLTCRLSGFDEKSDPTHLQPVVLEGLERLLRRRGLRIVEQWSYPERGSLIHGRPLRALAALLRPFVPDRLRGDTLCLWIRRHGAA